MAKPRQIHNGPDTPEGPWLWAAETRGEGEELGTGGEGVEGKERATEDNPPSSPPEQPSGKGTATRPERERRRRQKRRRRKRTKRRKMRGPGTETPTGSPGRGRSHGGGSHPPIGKRGPPGFHPRTCAPVVAGSLWRLPASQQKVAPRRGNRGQRCMAALMAPSCCSVRELVRHNLWSGGAPLHGYLGRGMAGVSCTELEL